MHAICKNVIIKIELHSAVKFLFEIDETMLNSAHKLWLHSFKTHNVDKYNCIHVNRMPPDLAGNNYDACVVCWKFVLMPKDYLLKYYKYCFFASF